MRRLFFILIICTISYYSVTAQELRNGTFSSLSVTEPTLIGIMGETSALSVGFIETLLGTDNNSQPSEPELEPVPIPIRVTGVQLNLNEATMGIGETLLLQANVYPTNADDKSVHWISEDEVVAKVDNGMVTALAVGNTVITVQTVDGNFRASCNVTVTDPTAIEDLESERVYVEHSILYLDLQEAQFVRIVNVSGQVIKAVPCLAGENRISMFDCATGIYYVCLKNKTIGIVKR